MLEPLRQNPVRANQKALQNEKPSFPKQETSCVDRLSYGDTLAMKKRVRDVRTYAAITEIHIPVENGSRKVCGGS